MNGMVYLFLHLHIQAAPGESQSPYVPQHAGDEEMTVADYGYDGAPVPGVAICPEKDFPRCGTDRHTGAKRT